MPVGFGHGFLTLTENAEVACKASDYYAPECDGGVAWDDPDIAAAWPLDGITPTLSAKDGKQPRLADWASPLAYDGIPMQSLD